MFLVKYSEYYMNMDNRTNKRKLGDIGEKIACEFLRKRGFEIIETNYLRKWGEIDIVAKKGEMIHFVEVKSVSRVTSRDVPYGTSTFRAEDNMHPWKLKRLYRTIETYLLHKKLDCDWQLDLVTVQMDMTTRQARVEIIENIVV